MLGMLGEEVASHAAFQITQLPTTQNVQCMVHANLGWALYALWETNCATQQLAQFSAMKCANCWVRGLACSAYERCCHKTLLYLCMRAYQLRPQITALLPNCVRVTGWGFSTYLSALRGVMPSWLKVWYTAHGGSWKALIWGPTPSVHVRFYFLASRLTSSKKCRRWSRIQSSWSFLNPKMKDLYHKEALLALCGLIWTPFPSKLGTHMNCTYQTQSLTKRICCLIDATALIVADTRT